MKEMNDLEAARHIDQALFNLQEDYPFKAEAHRAFGRLILGRLRLKPKRGVIHIESGKPTTIEYEDI